MSPDTESQKSKRRRALENQGGQRKLALSDVPFLVRSGAGERLSEIASWAKQHLTNAMQHLEDVDDAEKIPKSLMVR